MKFRVITTGAIFVVAATILASFSVKASDEDENVPAGPMARTGAPSPPAQPGASPSLAFWTGASYAPVFGGAFLGAVVPFQGNLWADNNLLFRANAMVGRYRYNATGFVNVHVDTYNGDLMVGYRKAVGNDWWLSSYIGANFDQQNNPDPAATVRGTQWGLRGIAELYGPLTQKLLLSTFVSYSTAFQTYYVATKVGYRITDKVSFGPEIAALGNTGFRNMRYGAATDVQTGLGMLILSAGFQQDISGSSKGGLYANLYLQFWYH